jgi:predicted metal-dependent phosphotriesterase family hydrolase
VGVSEIQTVLGPVAPESLGLCLPHEHIWCDQRLAPRANLFGTARESGTPMRLDDEAAMREELRAFADRGGGAIVEVTCDGWGRDLDVLARLSAASGVHVIATAGYYIEPCIPWYVDAMDVETLADHVTRELEVGVGGGTRRCGLVKSAIHRARVEGIELKVLRAVARAHRRTGVAITTHTTGGRRQEVPGGTVGPQQLEVLVDEGVSPDRLIVGHVDERLDVDLLASLAARGCYVQFDVIGKEHWLLDATRAELVRELIRRGHVERLLLSHDRNRPHEMRYGGGTGYLHLLDDFLPRLRAAGVDDRQIHTMTVTNPARALTPAPA